MQREIKIVLEQVNLYNLDCSDLTIITECASGVYGFNVLVPLLGKAKQVIAVGQDSCYGSYQDNKAHLLNICKHAQVDVKKLSIVNQLSDSDITSADIITNSGFVRPINAEMIKKMKKTAVIPLMWETWEFRHQDLDLFSAREYEIMVLGTDESYFKLAMYPYGGMLGLSALFRVGLEIYKTRAILLGGGILGQAIADSFSKNGVKFKWYVENPYQKKQLSYSEFGNHVEDFRESDVLLFAELEYKKPIIGNNQDCSFKLLREINPELKIVVIAGNIDKKELQASKLDYFPENIMPVGYMSYQAFHLGPKPVIELFAAGLKVGEVMARCRLQGMSLAETINTSLLNSPAMDFPGGGFLGFKLGN